MANRITKLLAVVMIAGAPASAIAAPRTLASGAPACGNSMGKGGYNDDCTTEERAQWRAEIARLAVEQEAASVAQKEQRLRVERQRRLARARERAARAATKIRALSSGIVTAFTAPVGIVAMLDEE